MSKQEISGNTEVVLHLLQKLTRIAEIAAEKWKFQQKVNIICTYEQRGGKYKHICTQTFCYRL